MIADTVTRERESVKYERCRGLPNETGRKETGRVYMYLLTEKRDGEDVLYVGFEISKIRNEVYIFLRIEK